MSHAQSQTLKITKYSVLHASAVEDGSAARGVHARGTHVSLPVQSTEDSLRWAARLGTMPL
jgi:hypothetical protein